MLINDVTIGADPELFIINTETGKVVSSIGLIPGEKGDPWVGEDMPKGFGMETDNIVAEFNIPPVRDCAHFINCIEYMKQYIDKFVKNVNPNLGILCAASQMVDKSELQSPQAKLFGCDVDFNAYTQEPNPKPKGTRTNLRSCGFHIHIGYRNYNTQVSLMLVKYLDAFLGLPSLLRDPDKKRRSLYGKAGCFRLTSYGVEYRVLSSKLMEDANSLEFVWNQTMKAIDALNCGRGLPPAELVVAAIDGSDIELANKLISEYNLL